MEAFMQAAHLTAIAKSMSNVGSFYYGYTGLQGNPMQIYSDGSQWGWLLSRRA